MIIILPASAVFLLHLLFSPEVEVHPVCSTVSEPPALQLTRPYSSYASIVCLIRNKLFNSYIRVVDAECRKCYKIV
jgi:hypothetical protein